jgi:hypothetical protein
MNHDFRWPFRSRRLHSDGIAHQAISDFIILPRVGCLVYLHLGRLFHVYKLRKEKVLLFSWTGTIKFTTQKKKKITITSLTV